MPDQLICKACDGSSAKTQKGCPGCGGHGYVAFLMNCPTCERSGYFRPNGGMTVYEGKSFYSIDGLEMIWHTHGSNCNRCEAQKTPSSEEGETK